MSIRTERVAREIQREVADLLQGEFHEASQSLLTVTGVRMTKDLGTAYVYVSVLGGDKPRRQIAFRRLEEIGPQIRQALAHRVRHQFRRVPELKFFLDESQEQVQHMESLFAQIRADREADGADDAATGETTD